MKYYLKNNLRQKKKKKKGAGDEVEVVVCLPQKCEVQSSNPRAAQIKIKIT
jgi:hypothetical protein